MSSLSTPTTLGAVEIRNRNVMSALTRSRSLPTNIPNETMWNIINSVLMEAQASLSPRALSSANNSINYHAYCRTEWPHTPGIYTAEHVAAWRKITDVVHAESAKIFSQLWHLGRANHPDMPEQIPVWAPSTIAARGGKFRTLPGQPGYATPTELPDPWFIIEQYKKAAINAKEAGFDGVEFHGANGYLPHQFFDSTTNKHTDMWGGSIENRIRFIREAVEVLISV
ncbi:hypothetical protein M422DRAFT_262678 [Sphaerobolus stellatus SS14]|uniref:NADH:flavin oxidoreductase/NADH oxidase N-terminal domain-containing protein n=1 Tax=Sphaerobolus stellatus (strain SS14) TaxID=990650 RepID=A0A0C9UJR5_SPHS4|nr:hypothetical protein M422DRAFT_262678 [Sphaerobolus stellatus SS14]